MRQLKRVVPAVVLACALGLVPIATAPAQAIPVILGCVDNFKQVASNEAAGKYTYSGYTGHCLQIPPKVQTRPRFVPRQFVPVQPRPRQAPVAPAPEPLVVAPQPRLIVEFSADKKEWRTLKDNERIPLPGAIRARVENSAGEITWGSNNGITKSCTGNTCEGITLPVGVTTITANVGGQEVAQTFTVPQRVAIAVKS